MSFPDREHITNKDLAEVARMVERGRAVPAVIARAIIARLEAAEGRSRSGARTRALFDF